MFAILPPGSVPVSQVSGSSSTAASAFVPSPVIEIRSSISLKPVQAIPFPPTPTDTLPAAATHTVRLLSPSPVFKSPLFVVTTPTDRTAATTAGSSIWCFRMKSWVQQIDELVEAEAYTDALSLLDSLDAALIADKVRHFVAQVSYTKSQTSNGASGETSATDSFSASCRPVPQREV